MRAWLARVLRRARGRTIPDAAHVQIRRLSALVVADGRQARRPRRSSSCSCCCSSCAAPAQAALEPGSTAAIDVSVATLWKAPNLVPLARPAVGRRTRSSRCLEQEPLDDGVARLARLARADAGALRPARDACSRVQRRLGEGRGARRARPAGSARISGLAAGAQLTTGFDAGGARRRRASRAPRRCALHGRTLDAELRHAAAARALVEETRRSCARPTASARSSGARARRSRRRARRSSRRRSASSACTTSGAGSPRGASTARGSSGTCTARTA